MKITEISKNYFLDQVYTNTDNFLSRIESPEIFIVKNFYAKKDILNYRNEAHMKGLETPDSWHPCLDQCPDYHRIHNNYPKAHVKAIMHAYYNHGYYESNNALFNFFSEIFDIKNYLADEPKGSFLKNIPSELLIARVNLHNYPKGGGYQESHIDPVSRFAKIQTIVIASEYGKDFTSGGVYAEADKKYYVDPFTEIGDLVVLSPGITHGVEAIDPEVESINWKENSGRWMIMPIIIHSDYDSKDNVKPKSV